MAAQHKSPIYVAANLFSEVEDMTEVLSRIQESGEQDEV